LKNFQAQPAAFGWIPDNEGLAGVAGDGLAGLPLADAVRFYGSVCSKTFSGRQRLVCVTNLGLVSSAKPGLPNAG